MYQIKRWTDNEVIFEYGETAQECLEEGVRQGVDFAYASLVDASLVDASLNGASLNGASLDGAHLDRASLDRAILVGASLNGASLNGAILVGASLDRAILDDAHLDRANLNGIIGNMREVRSGQIETYAFAYTHNRLQIGCENYAIEEWKKFSDADIRYMDAEAGLEWWKKWKDWIFALIEKSPAAGPEKK